MNFSMAKFIINLLNKPGGMKKITQLSKVMKKDPSNMIKSAFKKTSGRKGKTIKTHEPKWDKWSRKNDRIEQMIDKEQREAMWRRIDSERGVHPIWGTKGIDW